MATPSNSGIITDTASGERHIPESTRADGSTRKAIKIRPGYRPQEDVELYKNRTAASFRERAKRMGIPGTTGLKEEQPAEQPPSSQSAASNKNAKRREARKKAKADDPAKKEEPSKPPEVDPEVEREKKARGLKKKLKQAKDLKDKKEQGEGLLPEQIAKVIKINELVRELDALGFDAEGDPKKGDSDAKKTSNAGKGKA